MYTYYKEVQREEHLLFAEEIFKVYEPHFTTEKPSSIHAIIKKYAEHKGIEVERLYYQTKNGLKRVYNFLMASEAIAFYLVNKEAK